MNIKIKFVSFCILILLAAILSLSATANLISLASAAEITDTNENRYFLKLEDGKLSVYHNSETIIADISVPELRAKDRILLEEGLWVNSYEDILKLIEDFNS